MRLDDFDPKFLNVETQCLGKVFNDVNAANECNKEVNQIRKNVERATHPNSSSTLAFDRLEKQFVEENSQKGWYDRMLDGFHLVHHEETPGERVASFKRTLPSSMF